jgi:hypothetical protein
MPSFLRLYLTTNREHPINLAIMWSGFVPSTESHKFQSHFTTGSFFSAIVVITPYSIEERNHYKTKISPLLNTASG